MRLKSFLFTALVMLVCFQASAISTPQGRLIKPLFEDTTLKLVPSPMAAPAAKKRGFFTKLKNKFLTLVLGKSPEGGSNTKTTLGWVSIGLFVLGIASLAFAPVAFLFLIPAGIVTGIVALAMKGDKNNKKERRTSRLLAIIGIVLGVGLIVGSAIALGNAHY